MNAQAVTFLASKTQNGYTSRAKESNTPPVKSGMQTFMLLGAPIIPRPNPLKIKSIRIKIGAGNVLHFSVHILGMKHFPSIL
jgi:hypothetical protein